MQKLEAAIDADEHRRDEAARVAARDGEVADSLPSPSAEALTEQLILENELLSRAIARLRKLDSQAFHVGDHVRITKQGRYYGNYALITDPWWQGRIKVKLDVDSS